MQNDYNQTNKAPPHTSPANVSGGGKNGFSHHNGHAADNCSLRFCRKGRQLNLRESRPLTQIFQWNLQSASHRFWAYVCAFSPELMVMAMAMVMGNGDGARST